LAIPRRDSPACWVRESTRSLQAGAATEASARSDAPRQRAEGVERHHKRAAPLAVPGGVAWPFPLYELALLTANYAADTGIRDLEISIVTPESAPLGIFGSEASEAVRELLEIREVRLHTDATAVGFGDGRLDVAERRLQSGPGF